MTMKPISLLLVDDNHNFLRAAERLLTQSEDVAILGTASAGEEALRHAQDLQPQIILLDIALPDISGIELIPHLREELPEVGIIALTIMDTDIYEQAALAAGADALLSKATLFTDLLPTIRRIAHLKVALHLQEEQGNADRG